MRPLVFDIARASFVDGPGIRAVVFMKGCPLRCLWCQNPESQLSCREVMVYPENCIRCGNCEKECYALARQTAGLYYPSEKLADLILRDNVFYKTSSGGVTFSGGEPLMFIEYIHEVVSLLKNENIHIAVETCGYFDYKKLEILLLPFIDLFLFDIKSIDPATHKMFTGQSNDLILTNFQKIIESGKRVIVRVPLIPGYTATEKNLSQIAGFFVQNKIETWALLPYNPSGIAKWKRLGKNPPGYLSLNPMTIREEKHWRDFFLAEVENGKARKYLNI
jgi:pyruvate formate lyase activating enzyme